MNLNTSSISEQYQQPLFGNVSIFCAWQPVAEYISQPFNRSKEDQILPKAKEDLPSPKSLDPNTQNTAMSKKLASELQPTLTSPETLLYSTKDGRKYYIFAEPIKLTIWQASRVMAFPSDGNPIFTLDDLKSVIPTLITAARRIAPSGIGLYFVLHIGTIDQAIQQRSWWQTPNIYLRPFQWIWKRDTVQEGATGGLAGRPVIDSRTLKVLLDVLDNIRASAGITLVTENTPNASNTNTIRDSAYYEHYSPSRRIRGYLVLDPVFSLLVDVAQEDVHTLLSIAQQAHLTPQGLEATSYGAILTRVSLWDSNSDIQAMLDDMTSLNRGTNAATHGQVLMSFALAGIGTLLALTQIPGARPGQLLAPLLLVAMAAIAHSLFAGKNQRIYDVIGILCLLGATILAAVILLDHSFTIPLLPSGSPMTPPPPTPTPKATPTLPRL